MWTRISTLVVGLSLALVASTAEASDCIRRIVDADGNETWTNLGVRCGRHGSSTSFSGHSKPRSADAQLQKLAPGSSAPTEFIPNDQTAKYDPYIKEACSKWSMPPALVRAIMNAESNFDPQAMSEKGAIGLMQLMPDTGDHVAVSDIHDPRDNIMGGVRYLRELTNAFDGDMVRVVAAYNAGPNAVKAAGGVPQIPETQDYVRKVLRLYYHYKGEAVPAGIDAIISR
ncbi:MAG: lytic transglycosylase domain-containing protein [Deltaproteobacteria bacterium]|nr:lytic transglycosylase domain-containing protein [Deltaproteobacteria bacterium]